MDQFLERCFYYSGQYDSQDHFAQLDKKLKEHEVISVCLSLVVGRYDELSDRMLARLLYFAWTFINWDQTCA